MKAAEKPQEQNGTWTDGSHRSHNFKNLDLDYVNILQSLSTLPKCKAFIASVNINSTAMAVASVLLASVSVSALNEVHCVTPPPSPTCGNQTTWGHVISPSESRTHPQWSLAAAGWLSEIYMWGKLPVWREVMPSDGEMTRRWSVWVCFCVSLLPCNIPVDERALHYSCNLLFVEFCSSTGSCVVFVYYFSGTFCSDWWRAVLRMDRCCLEVHFDPAICIVLFCQCSH